MSLDWSGLMRAGMREAGLKPEEFWALTPGELALILGREGTGMGRGRLEELAALFPDGG